MLPIPAFHYTCNFARVFLTFSLKYFEISVILPNLHSLSLSRGHRAYHGRTLARPSTTWFEIWLSTLLRKSSPQTLVSILLDKMVKQLCRYLLKPNHPGNIWESLSLLGLTLYLNETLSCENIWVFWTWHPTLEWNPPQ